ncbi:helix-turn-helix domain-containing protein [Streptomyces sp. NPDC005708]|uniref:helix-turn-helix domain-containing protein n=1 Tax=Streptomyces sp. NPDC005708 TaxID=3154564 RepID=UPI0033F2ED24
MSLDPILWAMKDAPTGDINEWGVLLCLAEAADEDGCNAFPAVKTIAAYAKISTRTVQRTLAALQERKLIAEGDQRAAQYIPEYRRPVVYDLLIPHGWYRDVDRVNAFRARLGRRPLTPNDRPAIAAAPPKKVRADKGRPKPRKPADDAAAPADQEGRLVVAPVENGPEEGGRLEVTPVENPEKGATTSHPLTSSREWGDYKSGEGRLEVTQTSPMTRTIDPPRPSVGSSEAAPATEGRTDGQPIDIRTQKQAARAVDRTPGVDLLLGLGHERPELLLTGKVLEDQARVVDGLLLGDWPRDLIQAALLRPLPPKTRSVGAVISRRLQELASTPVPQRTAMPSPRDPEDAEWYGERGGSTPTPPAFRPGGDVEAFVQRSPWKECRKCRNPITRATGTDHCAECSGWPKCDLCRRFVEPGTACDRCEVVPGEAEFAVCETHGDRYVAGTACFQCSAPTP